MSAHHGSLSKVRKLNLVVYDLPLSTGGASTRSYVRHLSISKFVVLPALFSIRPTCHYYAKWQLVISPTDRPWVGGGSMNTLTWALVNNKTRPRNVRGYRWYSSSWAHLNGCSDWVVQPHWQMLPIPEAAQLNTRHKQSFASRKAHFISDENQCSAICAPMKYYSAKAHSELGLSVPKQ